MAQVLKPPATHRVYDACVIGSQLGGVVAGALLARRGYRVLHVDHDGVGASYEDQGWLLPYVPALLPPPRLFPAAETCLQELGLLADVQRALEITGPDLQLLLPRARLELARDPARRAADLRREFPADAARLEAAFAALAQGFDAATPFLMARPPLPARGLRQGWALRRAVRSATLPAQDPFAALAGHPLARALRTLARFLGYLDGDLPPLAAVRLLGAAARGSHRIPGGLEALRELIRRRIAESRGELLGGGEGGAAIAEGLQLDGRRVAAVRVSGSKDAFEARVFLLATDAPAARRLLPEAERDGKRARILAGLRSERQLVSVNWVVGPQALPPGLGDTALVLPEFLDDADAVLLQITPARRVPGKEKTPGVKTICAAGFLPSSVREQGEAALEAWAGRVRASLADALPFFDRHLLHESLPVAAAARERRGSRLMPHPIYQVASPGPLGVTGLPTRSPWKNVLFAGREVIPGLGVEGEFHAGLQAAAAAERLLGKATRPR